MRLLILLLAFVVQLGELEQVLLGVVEQVVVVERVWEWGGRVGSGYSPVEKMLVNYHKCDLRTARAQQHWVRRCNGSKGRRKKTNGVYMLLYGGVHAIVASTTAGGRLCRLLRMVSHCEFVEVY